MNRALLIILIPAILVALGYVLVFRVLGISAGYSRFILGGVIFLIAAYWLWPRKARGGAKGGQ
jgi:ABC-type spermidine/putrescine transport system permease subunit II